jgi:hypothetical protein
MKLWKMKKSCDFGHEIMNLVEKNVGTPAILGRTLQVFPTTNHVPLKYMYTCILYVSPRDKFPLVF